MEWKFNDWEGASEVAVSFQERDEVKLKIVVIMVMK